jgi:hypothetical protein
MQNYGFAKTIINKNNKKTKNEIMWNGDYNGNIANIEVNMNDNGNKEIIKMQLDNNDILNMLGVQPINMPLEQRLQTDFLDEPSFKSLDNRSYNRIKYLNSHSKSKKTKHRRIRHKKTIKNVSKSRKM